MVHAKKFLKGRFLKKAKKFKNYSEKFLINNPKYYEILNSLGLSNRKDLD